MTAVRRAASAPVIGLAVALALAVLAMAVPALLDWNVHVFSFPPLHAEWDPRTGPGTLPALVIAALASWQVVPLAERVRWGWLLVAAFVVGLAWLLALALVDGRDGIGVILETPYEYLRQANRITDVHQMLHEYISRIPYSAAPRNWPVHLAGHPPGAVLFFIGLVRLGWGDGYDSGLVVTVIAASTAVAVMLTMKLLGAESAARKAAPFLVLGPAAIWQAVSADAMFAAVAAWGIAALALAATRRRHVWSALWAVVAGLLLGYGVMLSYGLPIMGLLALVVLWLARSWRPLPYAVIAAIAVVGWFAANGFSYWDALPALHDRYWDGVAEVRPPSYWMWANFACLAFSAGPLVGAGLAQASGRWRDSAARVPVALATSGFAMVLVADLSQMSRGEVERIWLPFVPWMLAACALLPRRWRRIGIVLQLVTALAVQHLLATGW